jgi:hypothetical protein
MANGQAGQDFRVFTHRIQRLRIDAESPGDCLLDVATGVFTTSP